MSVSVIIPVYNVMQYLRECVDGVLCQSYTDLQVVLVDDGSTDQSGALCDEYARKDERVEVIHKPNGGLSDARNSGLKAAKGEYVLFLDADDKWGSGDFVEKLATEAQRTNADVVLCAIQRFRDNEDIHLITGQYEEDDFQGTASEILLRLMRKNRFSMSAWQKLIRQSILVENNITFNKGLLGEDMDWVQHLWQHVRRVSFQNEAVYLYRVRKGSITTTFGQKNAEDFCWILETWKQQWEQSDLPDRKIYLGYLAYLYVTLVYDYYTIPRPVAPELKQRILVLAGLLDYSLTRKSNRLLWLKRLTGRQGMLLIAGKIGYYRKKRHA